MIKLHVAQFLRDSSTRSEGVGVFTRPRPLPDSGRDAVGTPITERPPRTEPYVRLSRIRLPPRVGDGEAIARPRMEDDRFRKPVVHQLRHPRPCHPILLATLL